MRSLNLFHLLLQKHGSRRDSVFTRYLLRGASEFGRHIKNNTKHEQQLEQYPGNHEYMRCNWNYEGWYY